jgi:hypothetical protein
MPLFFFLPLSMIGLPTVQMANGSEESLHSLFSLYAGKTLVERY